MTPSQAPNSRAYWILQTSGWLFFSIINFISLTSFNYSNASIGAIISICVFGGTQMFVLTHLYRYLLKRRGWLALSYGKLVPLILAFNLILATFSQLTASVVAVWILKIFPLSEYSFFYLGINIFQAGIWITIWSLLYLSIHFFRTYKSEELERWQLQAAATNAELAALKAQVNPHFIFNCLNNIRSLVLEDPQNARTAITRLSDLLRSSIQFNKSERVTLAAELNIVTDYLALEKIHMEDRLRYSINTDAECENYLIPPMAIQLLVENAIKHSLSHRPDGGQIMIDSKQTGSYLCIRVFNTGQLISEEPSAEQSTQTGLANLRDRLQLLFGPKAVLTLENESIDQVVATLTLPAEKASEPLSQKALPIA